MNDAVTKQQADPKGRGTPISDLVVDDLLKRKEFGTAKYGEPLKPFNGRDPMIDLYQELIDAVMYVRQQIEEDKESELGKLRQMLRTAAEYAYDSDVVQTHMEELEVGEGLTYADKEDWIESWFSSMIDYAAELPKGLINVG